jgi:hypothetical protein
VFFSPRDERFLKNKVAKRLIAAMQRMRDL